MSRACCSCPSRSSTKKRAATAAAAAWSLINRSMQTYLLLLCYLIDLDQPKTLWQREEEEKKTSFFFYILRREMDCLSTAFQGGIFLINAYFNVLIYEPLFWPWTRGKLESCLGQIMEMLPQRNTSQMYPRYDNSALNCFNGHLRTAPKSKLAFVMSRFKTTLHVCVPSGNVWMDCPGRYRSAT